MQAIPDLAKATEDVISLVKKVARFIQTEQARFSTESIEYKGFNNLVSYVDKQAEIQLVEGCKVITPEASFLTEEGTVEAKVEGKKGLVWVIDPLDGTTNFIHKVPIYAISVGLVLDGTPILGVIAHIPNGEIYSAWQGGGAWCNGKRISVNPNAEMGKALFATGFPYFQFEKINQYLAIIYGLMQKSHGLRRLGSAAIDLAYVANGTFEGFFEYNLSPWDVAAGICLVREAGGTVTDFSGGDNALFGSEIVAAGPVYADFLRVIQEHWERKS